MFAFAGAIFVDVSQVEGEGTCHDIVQPCS